MKKYSLLYIILLLVAAGACKQDIITPRKKIVEPPQPAQPGAADFTKFVAIGNSFVAGFQAGALFTAGQNNSLAVILNTQFKETVTSPPAFNQPTIGSEFGYNIFISPNPDGNNNIFGRFLLQGADPRPTPQLAGIEALPNPQFNPGFIYTGAALNNFSVEAITLGQFLIPNTGNWADPNPAHGFSPFYARFASAPGTSTIIGDAAGAGGSFFLFWAGLDDFLLYAAYGGDSTKAPRTPAANFGGYYNAAIGALLGSNADLKGVVGNFPNIFAMPYFTAVPWNAIPMTDQPTVDATNGAYAPYNGGLAAAKAGGLITEAEMNQRMIMFALGANAIVIADQSLTDLSGLGLPSIRQTTSADIIPLLAGNVLGTEAIPGNPATTIGVGMPLEDQYALIPSEINAINSARIAFNATIKSVADANPTRLAFADVDAAMNTLVQSQFAVIDNVTITPNIDPPTGIYSEDGIHPNSRGYAFIANAFISAVNAKFTATIHPANLGLYPATGLPIP